MVRDEDIIGAIKDYWVSYYRPPSLRNITEALGLKSAGSLHSRLNRLESEGRIVMDRGGSFSPRSIRLPNMRIVFDEQRGGENVRYGYDRRRSPRKPGPLTNTPTET